MGGHMSSPTASVLAAQAPHVLWNALQLQEALADRGKIPAIPHRTSATHTDESAASSSVVLINTLPLDQQDCLIAGTLSARREEAAINALLEAGRSKSVVIVVYGAHHSDPTVWTKLRHLQDIGFSRSVVYAGGLFEWMLLQNAHGNDEFPTRGKELNLLRHLPPRSAPLREKS